MLNGIIENHAEIKQALIADGARFSSETDAEVVAHLIKRATRATWSRPCARRTPSSTATSPSSRSTATIRTCSSARAISAR